MSLISSPTLLLEEIVIGSLTTPLSNFFTTETSLACSLIGKFLWIIPMPPNSAKVIDMLLSVTVSIAAETTGIFKFTCLVNFVLKSVS